MTKKLSAAETDELREGIEQFDLEIGSGASFEQYFRWAEKAAIEDIVRKLYALGLNEIAETTQLAIEIAFPDGVPSDQKQKDDLTYWSPIQEKKLKELYNDEFHAAIENSMDGF